MAAGPPGPDVPAGVEHGGRVQLLADGPFATLAARTPDGRMVRLHSHRDPAAEADRLVEPLFAAGAPGAVIVIGLGLGYVLDAIERRTIETPVIGLEPLADAVPLMRRRRDWTTWETGRRFALFVGPDYHGASEAFALIDGQAGPPAILVHPVFKREFPAEAARAQRVAESVVAGARANEEARRKFSGPYLINSLKNLPAMAAEADVASLFDEFRGLPGIIVGAGPSLDRELPALKRFEDRAVLVAVDTALRPLMTAGVRPHFVVAVDPQDANAKHLHDLDGVADTWLVAEGSVDASVFPAFTGRTFCFKVSAHQPWPWWKELGFDRGTLRAWGSVLTTAFDFMCRAGCNPIVFVGADLAYTDGLLYCRNSIYEPDWKTLETDAERAEAFRDYVRDRSTVTALDTSGNVVATTPLFVQFRDWLVSRSVAVADRQILNATGAGILRGGRIGQADLASIDFQADGQAADIRGRISRAWRHPSRTADDGGGRAFVRQAGAALAPVLCAWPPSVALEPLRSFLQFVAEPGPTPVLVKTLFDLLSPDARQPFVAGLRRWLNANPTDEDARRVWNLIGGESSAARPATGVSATDVAAPWPAPDEWQAGIEANAPVVDAGLQATADTVITSEAARDFHSPWYLHLNARRLEHLASLGLDLRAKTVLEVGAGIGDLTSFFTDRGCAVLATDARGEHVQRMRERYGKHPHVHVDTLCLDPPPAEPVGGFDLVFCYGVLYHLTDPEAALAYLASCCRGLMLVESVVHVEPGPFVQSVEKDPSLQTASIAGVLAKPHREWLHERLRGLFPFVYVPDSQPNHYLYPTDWTRPVPPAARAVFVASRHALACAQLRADLPLKQRRH